MSDIFLKLLNLSVQASWLTLAVLAARALLARTHAPKSVRVLMWGLVGLRLIFPFSVESALSLLPSREVITPEVVRYSPAPEIHTGVPVIDRTVNPAFTRTFAPALGASVNPLYVLTAAAAWVWLAGLAAMAVYFAVSALSLRRRVSGARETEPGVREAESIPSPFVFGFIRPRIYLPAGMDSGSREYVLAHERAHIARLDHLVKPLAFLVLAVYWFNPVMWLAYVLLCRDIELACDERVLASYGPSAKKPYSEALLAAVTFHRHVAACPVAFGEGKLRGRVKNVLRWKRPVIWLTAASLVLCAILAVCFLTDPRARAEDGPQEQGEQELPDPGDIPGIYAFETEYSGTESHVRLHLRPDGSFFCDPGNMLASSLSMGNWSLDGDILTLTGSGTATMRLTSEGLETVGEVYFMYVGPIPEGSLFVKTAGAEDDPAGDIPAEGGQTVSAPGTVLTAGGLTVSVTDVLDSYSYGDDAPEALAGLTVVTCSPGAVLTVTDPGLRDGQPALEFTWEEGGEKMSEKITAASGPREVPDGLALADLEAGRTLMRFDLSPSPDSFDGSLTLTRRDGGLAVTDNATGGIWPVEPLPSASLHGTLSGGWYGNDWLWLRYDGDTPAIWTLGDEYARIQGTDPEFYAELFSKVRTADGALAESLASALTDAFCYDPSEFVSSMPGGEDGEAVAALLVYDADYRAPDFRRRLGALRSRPDVDQGSLDLIFAALESTGVRQLTLLDLRELAKKGDALT